MNVFELFGIIAINNKDANKGIDETGRKAQGLQAKMGRAFTKIGKDAIACGKAVAKGMVVVGAAGAAAAAALVKSSVSAYAEFEQLEGGVKKLFGEDWEKVMENARKAYQTAGLSANEYLSQTTRFSASLISGLGGDTEAAARMANIAIEDMSDNANTFGTDITRIQDAYQNFAKGQFQLLDNLSLGYGGSQEEMARLINDSGVMGDKFKATAENVKDISFAKIIEAIHVVQKEMNITGTTTKEATDTIAGSFNMWKASWKNLMTGLGDDENIDQLVDAFFDAGNKVLQNLAKVLPKIGKNLKTAMVSAGQNIRKAWVQNIWPSIQEFTTIKFGIELPDWSVVENSLSSWWNNTGKPAIENIKSFFADIATWVNENKEMITGFLIAAAGALLIMNAPLLLLVGLLAIVAANWETIKAGVNKAIDAMNTFFTQTIPEAWKNMVKEVKEWWGENVETPINKALNLLKEFFNQPSLKEVVLRITTIQSAGGDLGDKVNNDPSAYHESWQEHLDNGGLTVDSTNASGLRYVPRDDHIAKLHMGEIVLPRHEADEYRSNKNRGTDTSRLETAVNSLIALTQQLVANTGARQQLLLNNGVVAGELAPHIDAKLGTLTARKERRG